MQNIHPHVPMPSYVEESMINDITSFTQRTTDMFMEAMWCSTRLPTVLRSLIVEYVMFPVDWKQLTRETIQKCMTLNRRLYVSRHKCPDCGNWMKEIDFDGLHVCEEANKFWVVRLEKNRQQGFYFMRILFWWCMWNELNNTQTWTTFVHEKLYECIEQHRRTKHKEGIVQKNDNKDFQKKKNLII